MGDNMSKSFLRHTLICFGISFIDMFYGNITQALNNKRSSFLLIASFVLIFIYFRKKHKNSTINNISFLKENEYKIKDNVKYNRRIEWGIEEESNWRNKWNNAQPKETTSFLNKFFYTIITISKFIILVYINAVYMTFIEAFLIIIVGLLTII